MLVWFETNNQSENMDRRVDSCWSCKKNKKNWDQNNEPDEVPTYNVDDESYNDDIGVKYDHYELILKYLEEESFIKMLQQ